MPSVSVCPGMYKQVYIYIYIHTYICTYPYTSIPIHACIWVYTYMCTRDDMPDMTVAAIWGAARPPGAPRRRRRSARATAARRTCRRTLYAPIGWVCVWPCVRACVSVSVRVCARVRVYVGVCACMRVRVRMCARAPRARDSRVRSQATDCERERARCQLCKIFIYVYPWIEAYHSGIRLREAPLGTQYSLGVLRVHPHRGAVSIHMGYC